MHLANMHISNRARMFMLAVVAVCLVVGTGAAPAADEIKNLPGLTHAISFKHYSGYLSGTKGKHLHYWFVESSRDPVTDPVVLWLNGGPGCSSMEGLLSELGPYLVNPDGKTLKMNPFAWNTVANLLFLEAPACVGLSYDDNNNCTTGDNETSLSNYLAIQDFFKNKFPEYRNNSFFITGESYAGIYVPTLAVRVLEGQKQFSINLQGYAIGNGLSSYKLNDNSIIFFAYYHGLLGDDLWAILVEHCCTGGRASAETCNFYNSRWPMCAKVVEEATEIIYHEGLNMYNLYDSCPPALAGNFTRRDADLSNIFRMYLFRATTAVERGSERSLNLVPPCTDATGLITYLSNTKVRSALHIPLDVKDFELCNTKVNFHYQREYMNMKPQYKFLAKHVRGLVYNGDTDMACNFLGDEWFVESLGLKVKENRRMWHQGGQVAGYVKRFANLDLVTVRGAGHMVPENKPAAALQMITSFLFRKSY